MARGLDVIPDFCRHLLGDAHHRWALHISSHLRGRWYGAAWDSAGTRTMAALKVAPVVATIATLVLLGSVCPFNVRSCLLSTPVPWPSAVLVVAAFFGCLVALAAALGQGWPWRFWF